MIQVASWNQVTVLKKWVSGKGTKCVRVGWMNSDGAGEHIFYGDDLYDQVSEQSVVSISGTVNEKGFVNVSRVTGGDSSAAALAGEEAPAGRRRRSAA